MKSKKNKRHNLTSLTEFACNLRCQSAPSCVPDHITQTGGKASLGVICSFAAQVEAGPTPEVAGEVFLPKEVGSVAILYRDDYNREMK